MFNNHKTRRPFDPNRLIRPRRRLQAVAIMLSLAASACSAPSSGDLIASAKTHLANGDRQGAMIQLKNALQGDADLAEARFLLGKALLDNGEAASATAELRRAADLKHPPAEVLPVLARSLLAEHQYKLLIETYSNAELSVPAAAADLKTSIAKASAAQGNGKKASEIVDAALAASPTYAPALTLQAKLKAEAGKVDEATKLIDQIILAEPKNAEAWQFKGDIQLFGKQDISGAKDSYERALGFEPDNSAIRSSLISLLLAQHNVKDAEVQIDNLKKTQSKKLQTVYFEAQLAYLKKDNDKARGMVQQLLKISPDNAKLLQLAGAIAFNQRYLLQAETHLSKSLQIRPELELARILLAKTQLQTGKPENALTTLGPIVDELHSNFEAHSLAGQAYLQIGNTKQAEASFTRATKINPGDNRTRATLAMVRLTDKNAEAVFDELEAIAAKDTDSYADLALVSSYLQRNNYDAAFKAIDNLERKQPGTALTSNLRGQIYLMRNDRSKARQSFEQALKIDPKFVSASASLANIDLAENRVESAMKQFQNVLEVDPKNLKALLALAGLQSRTSTSSEDIAKLLNTAIQLNPTEIAPRLLLVDHYLVRRNIKMALVSAQQANGALPGSAELLDALGRAQLANGEANQAVSTFSRLVELRPEALEAHLHLGAAYIAVKNNDAALRTFNRILALKSGFLPAQRAIVDLHRSEKHFDQAMLVARQVQAQRPLEATGLLLQADIELSDNKYFAATESYQGALKRSPTTQTAIKLHSSLGLQRRHKEADQFAASWLKDKPGDPDFLFYLGELAIGSSHFTVAKNHFERVLAVNPTNALALNNLAWVLVQLGDKDALTLARRANELLPNTPALMDTLAIALASAGQIEESIKLQRKALILSDNNPVLRLTLAKLLIQVGNKSDARTELELLIAMKDRPAASQLEVSQLLRTL